MFFRLNNKQMFIPYNTSFVCKLHQDSITAKLRAVDFDGEDFKMNKNILVTFKFIQATCDQALIIPQRTDWEVGKNRMRKVD